jgi:hypothetical protein
MGGLRIAATTRCGMPSEPHVELNRLSALSSSARERRQDPRLQDRWPALGVGSENEVTNCWHSPRPAFYVPPGVLRDSIVYPWTTAAPTTRPLPSARANGNRTAVVRDPASLRKLNPPASFRRGVRAHNLDADAHRCLRAARNGQTETQS